MRVYIYLIVALIFSLPTYCQSLHALYNVKLNVNLTGKSNVMSFDYDGHLYKSNGQHIYFQKPLYLEKYPSGDIIFEEAGEVIIYPLWLDTLQRISYYNTDSLIFRTRNDMSGENAKNDYYVRKFELGVQEWKLLPETKVINGLFCQRANFFHPISNKLIWDVWFCPSIQVNFGPGGIRDIPGLVVEALDLGNRETYLLESYTTDISVPKSVFWLEEFNNAVFIKLKPMQKIINKQKTDSQKRLEIMNQ